MKLLTLNTWQERGPWQDRWELIFQGVDHLKPDVIFFQEIFKPEWIREIAKRTGYSTAVYHEPDSGLALFSHFPLIRSMSWILEAQSPRENYRRGLLCAQFQTKQGSFHAFNTHLSWMLEDSQTRQAQTREIAKIVADVTGSGEAVIAGDFNSVAWAPEIQNLLGAAGFCDVYANLNPGQAGLTWTYENFYTREGRHPLPDRRIDFIFTYQPQSFFLNPLNGEVVFQQPSAAGVLASDHYGVQIDFRDS